MTIRFGAKVDNYGEAPVTEGIATSAKRAEEAGFDSVWCSDHVVMPAETRSAYPFSADGTIRWNPADPWFDAVVTLAVMAAATDRVEVGPGVLLLPLRHPVTFAKQAASIDALSGGRLVLGVGVGWLREEFDALEIPFESRGERADEWIDLLRACWTGRPAAFAGTHHTLPDGVLCYPTPVRDVPIIIGGMSRAALRRAATRGDGWFPLPRAGEDPVAVIRAGREQILADAVDAGRGDWTPRIVYNAAAPEDATPLLPALEESGVTDVLIDVDYADPEGPQRALAALRIGVA